MSPLVDYNEFYGIWERMTIGRAKAVNWKKTCTIVEPARESFLSENTCTIASANCGLAPPVPIFLARVLVTCMIEEGAASFCENLSLTNLHPSLVY